MPVKQGTGYGAVQVLASSTGTGGWTRVPSVKFHGLQIVATSTDLAAVLEGRLGPSSTARTLITWSSTEVSGNILWTTDPMPVDQVRCRITGGASSGGADAWASGI